MPLPLLKCIVVDDEPPSIYLLEGYINDTPSLQWQKSFTNPLNALAWLTQNETDLVFLDISMPELNGLDFAKTIMGKAQVILCTAYREYGADSYEFGVTDYLVKPVSYVRFLAAVQKALDEAAAKKEEPVEQNDFLMVTGTGRFAKIKINFADIHHIVASKNNVVFHMEKETKTATITLKELEARLPAKQFVRVHHSYIVCISQVARLNNNAIVMKQGVETIPIGPVYRDAVLAALKVKE
jgi:two-component system, LytTR family, response regulator